MGAVHPATGATQDPLPGHSRLEISADVVSRCILGETIILDFETEQYFGLDGVGSRLWELLCEGTTLEHAVTVISGEYEVDPALVDADVRAVLDHLLSNQLVTVTPLAGGGA